MNAVWKREMQSYFLTPVGYVFMGVFLALSGLMFYMMNLAPRSSDVLLLLGQLSFIWMLLSPVLTMRLLAEERHQKTDQLLLTSPVPVAGVVLGKYLAAVAVMLLTVALTWVFVAVIALYGRVYPSELWVGYGGFILQGCAFLALDLFISGLCKSQVTAAVSAFGVNLTLWLIDLVAPQISFAWAASILDFVSLYARYEPFLMGQLSWAAIAYYLAFIAFFVAASVYALDARRWRENA
ncbi:MAG: ABC transporter permease [Clostridia bacterium]|nr:ABC transporter permease [Clostridia bacterium]